MSRPVVGVLTERIYDSLPEVYRLVDPSQPVPGAQSFGTGEFGEGTFGSGTDVLDAAGYPLLRYLSLLFDEVGTVEALLDRITFRGSGAGGVLLGEGSMGDGTLGSEGTSALVDPGAADASWLPWIAQLLGVRLDLTLAPDQQRTVLETPEDAWEHGTPSAIIDLAKTKLTATKAATLTHPSAWVLQLNTKHAETAQTTTFAQFVTAGIVTMDDWRRAGSFDALATPAVVAVARPEVPGGFKLTHGWLD